MKERKIYIDILKILSCAFVIYIHTCGTFVDSTTVGTAYIISLIFFFIAKTAVPIFLMISGAMLFRKEETIKKSLSRAMRMIIALFIVSFAYYLYYHKTIPTPWAYFQEVYMGEIAGVLWYLYMYIGLMIMLPIFRSLKLDRKKYIYLFSVFMLIDALPQFICYYFAVQMPSHMLYNTFFSRYLVCFLLGDFIDKEITEDKYTRKNFGIVGIITVVDIAISLFCVLRELDLKGRTQLSILYGEEFYITTFILCGCVFFLVKYLFRNVKPKAAVEKVIGGVAGCTFGIYLIHFLYVYLMADQFKMLTETCGLLPGILLFDLLVFATSLGTMFLLRLIPFMKKLY